MRAAALVILLSAVSSQAAEIPSRALAVIERYVRAEMALNEIPGLTLAIVAGDHTELRAYGVKDLASGEPMRVDTPVELASVSKPLTAMAVARLARAGRLDPDRPLSDYLAELRGAPLGRVLVRDLVRHRSGLRRRHDRLAPCCGRPGDRDLNLAVRRLRSATPARWVAGRFSYANSNYLLLAALIERVSGQPFARFMEQEIFRTLGMDRTTLSEGQARAWGLAASHERSWGRIRRRPAGEAGWLGASLVKSTAPDMAAFARAALEGRVDGIEQPEGLVPPYDAGWFIRREDGLLVLEHSGDTWGANSAILLIPARQLGVAVLINAGVQRAMPIARGIARCLLYGSAPEPARPPWFQVADNWAMFFTGLSVLSLCALGTVWLRLRNALRRGERQWIWPQGVWERGRLLLLLAMSAYLLALALRPAVSAVPGSPSSLRVGLAALSLAASAGLLTVAGLAVLRRPPQL